MTREQKLALIMGFALVLVVGVLVSDHLSQATRDVSLTTDGLDDRMTLRESREVNTLLVNKDALKDPTYATPEPGYDDEGFDQDRFARNRDGRPADRDFFRGVRDSIERAADEMGDLPHAARKTRDRDDADAPGVPEVEMGKSIPTAERPAAARIYRVRPNDSLWGIAMREYGDGALHTRLAAYNHDRVGDDGAVREGASLLIPPKGVLISYQSGDDREVEREARGPAPRAETPRAPRTRAYTVKKGQTLSEICMDELGTSRRWREVVELNGGAIPEDGIVRAGQKILLPAD